MAIKSLEVFSYVSVKEKKNSSINILSMSKSCVNRSLNCLAAFCDH